MLVPQRHGGLSPLRLCGLSRWQEACCRRRALGALRRLMGRDYARSVRHLPRDEVEATLLEARAREFDLPVVDVHELVVDPEVAVLVSPRWIRRHRVLPMYMLSSGELLVAVEDPRRARALDTLRLRARASLRLAVGFWESIEAYALTISTRARRGGRAGALELPAEADSPIEGLVVHLMSLGLQRGASEIHFDPVDGMCRVRYRLGTLMRELPGAPSRYLPAIVDRFKFLACLDVTDDSRPQSGRFTVVSGAHRLDLDVSVWPGEDGESVTLRVRDEAAPAPLPEA